jgi:hypothetical protein
MAAFAGLRLGSCAMGILNARPKLEPGEALAWKSAANHVAGSIYTLWGMKTASGGQLVLTDRRIFFQPGRADALLRERVWQKPVEEIDGFEIVGPDGEVFGGGMRNRLGIRSGDELEVFVVNKLEKKLGDLRALTGKQT